MARNTGIGNYLGFLRELGDSGAAYFLKGGQAVNFRAEYFSAKGAAARESEEELALIAMDENLNHRSGICTA